MYLRQRKLYKFAPLQSIYKLFFAIKLVQVSQTVQHIPSYTRVLFTSSHSTANCSSYLILCLTQCILYPLSARPETITQSSSKQTQMNLDTFSKSPEISKKACPMDTRDARGLKIRSISSREVTPVPSRKRTFLGSNLLWIGFHRRRSISMDHNVSIRMYLSGAARSGLLRLFRRWKIRVCWNFELSWTIYSRRPFPDGVSSVWQRMKTIKYPGCKFMLPLSLRIDLHGYTCFNWPLDLYYSQSFCAELLSSRNSEKFWVEARMS